jgi:hypothetical protein
MLDQVAHILSDNRMAEKMNQNDFHLEIVIVVIPIIVITIIPSIVFIVDEHYFTSPQ